MMMMMMMMNNEIHMYRSRLSAAVIDIDIADILGQKYRQMRFGPSSSQLNSTQLNRRLRTQVSDTSMSAS